MPFQRVNGQNKNNSQKLVLQVAVTNKAQKHNHTPVS